MKLLVCISNVPDTTTKVRFVNDNTAFDTNGVQWIINPWDELALTRAMELREDASSGIEKVTVITVGPVAAEPTLRKALAIGADDAIRVDAEGGDAYLVASQIAEVVKKDDYDIILNGIESSDYNSSAVGGMLAELLDRPSVSAVSSLQMENGEVLINREIDGGKEELSIPVPFVAVVQKGIAKEPRIPAMRGIMM
ncbi:MAG: electron transfer flavoprotein subunit beta/FixA family protein, partial [Bacteroidales bacterium]|nr:electron transfer flavoprotein subunit beta/FixA family protein [Bacteroidales bacterium]